MSKIISEVLKELKEEFPNAHSHCKGLFVPKNLTGILVNQGYLYQDNDGKHPTELGEENGISEYWRVKEDGKQFWQVVYNEHAEQMLHTIFEQQYSDIITLYDGHSEMVVEHMPGLDRAGRRGSREIRMRHPTHIVFQESEGRTWAFDDNAQEICHILNTEPYENAMGETGVSFESSDFDSVVVPKLKQQKKSYIVNRPQEMEIVSFKAQAVHAPITHPELRPVTEMHASRTAVLGDYLTLNSEEGKMNVYLAMEETGSYQPIMHDDGGIEFINVPEIERNGHRLLSPDSPLSQALIGKQINDTITVNGFRYNILSIYQ